MSDKIIEEKQATYCCAAFKSVVLQLPDADNFAPYGIELDKDGLWYLDSCCGGHCYSALKIAFCPWCGAAIGDHVRSG